MFSFNLHCTLGDSEAAHQDLRVAHTELQSQYSNEVTETRGLLKLKSFEHDRTVMRVEELNVELHQVNF